MKNPAKNTRSQENSHKFDKTILWLQKNVNNHLEKALEGEKKNELYSIIPNNWPPVENNGQEELLPKGD